MASNSYTVEFILSRKTIVLKDGEYILEAAEKAGIEMAADCRQGVCGACMSKCSGPVEFTVPQKVLTQEQIDEGWILTCICKVKGPLKIEE